MGTLFGFVRIVSRRLCTSLIVPLSRSWMSRAREEGDYRSVNKITDRIEEYMELAASLTDGFGRRNHT